MAKRKSLDELREEMRAVARGEREHRHHRFAGLGGRRGRGRRSRPATGEREQAKSEGRTCHPERHLIHVTRPTALGERPGSAGMGPEGGPFGPDRP